MKENKNDIKYYYRGKFYNSLETLTEVINSNAKKRITLLFEVAQREEQALVEVIQLEHVLANYKFLLKARHSDAHIALEQLRKGIKRIDGYLG